MKRINGDMRLSPTDLSNFLSCRHRNVLELSTAHGLLKKPVRSDPLLDTLKELGLQHERDYIKWLEGNGKQIVDLSEPQSPFIAMHQTLQAMQEGAEVIVQVGLGNDRWFGIQPSDARKKCR